MNISDRGKARLLALAALGAAVAAGVAAAQRSTGYDRAPSYSQAPGRDLGAGLPGKFDYYSLVLSWSPSYCAGLIRGDYDPQCHRRDGRRYAFILHGLWPQYERGYPEFCPTRERAFVPQSVIDRMQDIMPSPKLTIHEYRKHGTCSGFDPAGYYDLSRNLFAKVKIPGRFQNPTAAAFVSPAEVVQDFLAANPGMKADMLAIVCDPRAGNRLKEIRVCFSKDGDLRSCGPNEDQRRLCSAGRMYVPPVRPSALGNSDAAPALPGAKPAPPGQRAL
jgi:ribonuclease T2